LYAREFSPAELPQLSPSGTNIGTNMHAAFMLARTLLGRQKGGNKQIIMITDGEPTAHMENGEAEFSYPPTRRTLQETLREVQRCTREGITINTFMLDRSEMLTAFVEQMARINRGRAFFATPERLGEYVLLDYVSNQRRAATEGSAIRLGHVSRSWGAIRAVDDVSFEAAAGKMLVLLGPSGCGKSTTLRLIAGLEDVSAGVVRIGGEDVTHLPPAARHLSMVFQSY